MFTDNTCNSRRSFSWLVRSCVPDPKATHILLPIHRNRAHLLPYSTTATVTTSFTSLPDDLLVECLSRLPLSSLPSISLVCSRFHNVLDTPAFLNHRRSHGLIRRSILALTVSDIGLLSSASYSIDHDAGQKPVTWEIFPYPLPLPSTVHFCNSYSFSHARLAVLGRFVYVLARGVAVRYDTWTEAITSCSPFLFPRKKFAIGVIDGKIYVAGGTSRTSAVEVYDPLTDIWRVVSEAPRKRYGCLGTSANGAFYVIGGLKIGGNGPTSTHGVESAHVYASTMDAYDVVAGTWLRTRPIPDGGCAVGACSVGSHVYVLASHAVEVSFWRWERKGRRFVRGEWERLRAPPVPGQVHVNGALRFSCVGVEENRIAVVVHVSDIGDSTRRMGIGLNGQNGWLVKDGAALWYNISTDEWCRGADLPVAFRKAACVCVEC
ncbi:F-box/kelch-repeat protein [Zostera marina]|uniref:F-box/kelch-repeat protein n=1 Tax=Zostera marina TaxID=29655 RepID=A0A0K9PNF5_ZOSMR|nr:F-box/kelch-repeat protein [Zostera marina]